MNNNKIEITKTELRGLIFWATTGIEKSNGGSYSSVVNYIRKNHKLMWDTPNSQYKDLRFGSRLNQ